MLCVLVQHHAFILLIEYIVITSTLIVYISLVVVSTDRPFVNNVVNTITTVMRKFGRTNWVSTEYMGSCEVVVW